MSFTRRDSLKTLGAALIGAPAIFTSKRAAAAKRLTIRDAGGLYTSAFTEAFYKPFTKETGIEIVPISSSAEPTAEVKVMVDTGNYYWDLMQIGRAAHDTMRDAGYLEQIGLESDPTVQEIPESMKTPYFIGEEVYATVLAYRTDRYRKEVPTGGWKDLWNIEKFRGPRSLRRHPFDTIEIALLADGVTLDELYPCDMDRALASLDRIKNSVSTWWQSGAESTQHIVGGEVDMIAIWHARAQAAIDKGAPVAISWNQGIYTQSGWCIPRGAPGADLARQFISFASRADRQAAYAPMLTGGPTNPGAYDLIPQERARSLPTHPDNLQQMVQADTEYWGAVKDKAFETFMTWMISR